jgi:protein involved in polysaccharide export with SLBB domain
VVEARAGGVKEEVARETEAAREGDSAEGETAAAATAAVGKEEAAAMVGEAKAVVAVTARYSGTTHCIWKSNKI